MYKAFVNVVVTVNKIVKYALLNILRNITSINKVCGGGLKEFVTTHYKKPSNTTNTLCVFYCNTFITEINKQNTTL